MALHQWDEDLMVEFKGSVAPLETLRLNAPHWALIRGDGEVALKHAVRVMGLCNAVGMDYRIAALEER